MWGGKGLFHCIGYSPAWRGTRTGTQAGSWGQKLKQKAWRNDFFLVCFPWLSLLAFLHNPEPPAQEGHSPHVLGPPTSVINQKNTPLEMPTGQSVGGNPSVEVPSCQMTLVCVKMAKTTQHSCGGHSVIHVINVVELCAFNAYNGKMYILHNLP